MESVNTMRGMFTKLHTKGVDDEYTWPKTKGCKNAL